MELKAIKEKYKQSKNKKNITYRKFLELMIEFNDLVNNRLKELKDNGEFKSISKQDLDNVSNEEMPKYMYNLAKHQNELEDLKNLSLNLIDEANNLQERKFRLLFPIAIAQILVLISTGLLANIIIIILCLLFSCGVITFSFNNIMQLSKNRILFNHLTKDIFENNIKMENAINNYDNSLEVATSVKAERIENAIKKMYEERRCNTLESVINSNYNNQIVSTINRSIASKVNEDNSEVYNKAKRVVDTYLMLGIIIPMEDNVNHYLRCMLQEYLMTDEEDVAILLSMYKKNEQGISRGRTINE